MISDSEPDYFLALNHALGLSYRTGMSIFDPASINIQGRNRYHKPMQEISASMVANAVESTLYL
jgi:hypothetical protein